VWPGLGGPHSERAEVASSRDAGDGMSGVGGDGPAGGLARIVFKLRTQGPRWIAKRLAAEAVYPTTTPGRVTHALARRGITAALALPRMIRRNRVPEFPAADRTLFAFYDLKVGPITFDCLWFLAGADLQRRRLGLDKIHVVIVPGPYEGVRRERDDYEIVIDPAKRGERIQNILIQACPLLASCSGLTQAGSRAEAAYLRSVLAHHVFPSDYEPALPVYPSSRFCLEAARQGERSIAALRATPERLRNIDRWLARRAVADRRLVTITLRGYDYMPVRNSNADAWAAFARGLDPRRYFTVFIPDTEQTIEGLPGALDEFVLMSEAAWNVGLRMALYQRAFLNMGVNNGPMGLCWLNETTRYATLKMAPAGVPQTTPESFRDLGFEMGRSLPFATPFQQLVWEDDRRDVIERVFAGLVARIESGNAANR
jgi:hypothetical protein